MNLDLPVGLVQFFLAVAVAIISTARLTRLISQDHWPPMVWARNRWRAITKDGDWSVLVDCPFCVAPYVAAVILAWGWFSGPDWVWWTVNGWLTLSYLASIVVVRDTPE